MTVRRMRVCSVVLILIGVFASAQDTWQKEGTELAALLQWHPGDMVADIGAGKGQLTAIAAEHVGPLGKIYCTETDSTKLALLQELAAKQKNIVPIKASYTDTNLPKFACDSIYMRLVYHHFTNPKQMDARLFQSLKHGGRLAIIDQEPGKGSAIPDGVPKNRLGHGIPQKVLIGELKHAGFKIQAIENNWVGGDEFHKMYCVVFLKP